MEVFSIPDDVIDGVAAEIHSKTHKDYKIPVVGVHGNIETPQVFEIMLFDQIDTPPARFYAIDGSRSGHTLSYLFMIAVIRPQLQLHLGRAQCGPAAAHH